MFVTSRLRRKQYCSQGTRKPVTPDAILCRHHQIVTTQTRTPRLLPLTRNQPRTTTKRQIRPEPLQRDRDAVADANQEQHVHRAQQPP